MKNKICLILFPFIIASFQLFSQSDLKYEKTDSVSKNKNQIYSDTKMFIADYWKSAQDVIQNDDKEAGMILIKGTALIYGGTGVGSGPYRYSYSIKFLMKDNRYKVVIYNIIPEMNQEVQSPAICNNCEFPGAMKTNMFKDKWKTVQKNFPLEMEKILLNYSIYLNENKSTESW